MYLENLRGTRYGSFRLSFDGPTLFQGANAPSSSVEGDLWIKTGNAPGVFQYVSGSWAALGGNGGPPPNLTSLIDAEISAVVPGMISTAIAAADISSQIRADRAGRETAHRDIHLLHVSTVSHPYMPTGTTETPFATIQDAHDYALANADQNDKVVILVHPGNYPFATISRPLTYVQGMMGLAGATVVDGMTIAPAYQITGGLYNTVVAIDDLMLASSTTVPLYITGSTAFNFQSRRCYFNNGAASGNTNAILSDMSVGWRCEINDPQVAVLTPSGGVCIVMKNATGYIRRMTLDSNGQPAYDQTGGTMTLTDCEIVSNAAFVVNLNSGSLNMGTSSVINELANGDGIRMGGAGCVLAIGTSVINVPAGAGYAVSGSTGSVMIYGTTAFFTNSKVSSAITLVPANLTPTPTA